MQEREISVSSTPVLGPMPPMMAVSYTELPRPSWWVRWKYWVRVRVRGMWFYVLRHLR